MILKIKKAQLRYISYCLFLVITVALFLVSLSFSTEFVTAGNVTNVTVLARVNVSNTFPDLYKVKIDHPLDSNGNIDLGAGNATTVICNGSFNDPNGFDDVVTVNATFYDMTESSSISADDNSTHYTNSSCGTCEVVAGTDNENGTCLCQFAVQYYANPGDWQCNMTIADVGTLTSTQNSSRTNVNEILGIGVESLTIDYGNLSVTQTSDPQRQNVTNLGNIPINISVRGFGGTDELTGQNVTMVCDPSQSSANISFNSQRFHFANETNFADMYNLTNQTLPIPLVTVPKRTTNFGYGNSTNSTFWRLQIPLGAGGVCNGSVIFGAVDANNTFPT